MSELSQTEQKKSISEFAVKTLMNEKKIFNGMKLSLGTGSTAMFVTEKIAELITKKNLLDVKICTTSFQTKNFCEEHRIQTFSFNDAIIAGEVDLAIDGADEVDENRNCIKGGGAALLREKIAAYNAKIFSLVVDESKLVKNLALAFPLPVEIIPEARVPIMKKLQKLGASCVLREAVKKDGPVITDNGNQILDCLWKNALDVEKAEDEIKCIPGVVEAGFFTKNKPIVFIAHKNGFFEVRR